MSDTNAAVRKQATPAVFVQTVVQGSGLLGGVGFARLTPFTWLRLSFRRSDVSRFALGPFSGLVGFTYPHAWQRMAWLGW
jgi:hypothetical protein